MPTCTKLVGLETRIVFLRLQQAYICAPWIQSESAAASGGAFWKQVLMCSLSARQERDTDARHADEAPAARYERCRFSIA